MDKCSCLSPDTTAGVLKTIYLFLEGQNFRQTCETFLNESQGMGYAEFKRAIARILVLKPSLAEVVKISYADPGKKQHMQADFPIDGIAGVTSSSKQNVYYTEPICSLRLDASASAPALAPGKCACKNYVECRQENMTIVQTIDNRCNDMETQRFLKKAVQQEVNISPPVSPDLDDQYYKEDGKQVYGQAVYKTEHDLYSIGEMEQGIFTPEVYGVPGIQSHVTPGPVTNLGQDVYPEEIEQLIQTKDYKDLSPGLQNNSSRTPSVLSNNMKPIPSYVSATQNQLQSKQTPSTASVNSVQSNVAKVTQHALDSIISSAIQADILDKNRSTASVVSAQGNTVRPQPSVASSVKVPASLMRVKKSTDSVRSNQANLAQMPKSATSNISGQENSMRSPSNTSSRKMITPNVSQMSQLKSATSIRQNPIKSGVSLASNRQQQSVDQTSYVRFDINGQVIEPTAATSLSMSSGGFVEENVTVEPDAVHRSVAKLTSSTRSLTNNKSDLPREDTSTFYDDANQSDAVLDPSTSFSAVAQSQYPCAAPSTPAVSTFCQCYEPVSAEQASSTCSVISRFELDYNKVKRQLRCGDSHYRTVLLQALRRRITCSSADFRNDIISTYARHDLLSLHGAPSRNYKSIVEEFLCSQCTGVIQEQEEGMARMINVMASLTLGRDYLCQDENLLSQLIIPLVMGNHPSNTQLNEETKQYLLVALQKLSLRNNMRLVMIQAGLVQYLASYLSTSHRSISDYCLEYSLALFMNLCLHGEARAKLRKMSREVVRFISDFLSNGSVSCLSYINGVMYSLFMDNDIRKEAKREHLDVKICDKLQFVDEEIKQQFEVILDILNTNKQAMPCTECDCIDQYEEVDHLEEELETGDTVTGDPNGEILLKEYQLIDENTGANSLPLTCLCRPITPWKKISAFEKCNNKSEVMRRSGAPLESEKKTKKSCFLKCVSKPKRQQRSQDTLCDEERVLASEIYTQSDAPCNECTEDENIPTREYGNCEHLVSPKEVCEVECPNVFEPDGVIEEEPCRQKSVGESTSPALCSATQSHIIDSDDSIRVCTAKKIVVCPCRDQGVVTDEEIVEPVIDVQESGFNTEGCPNKRTNTVRRESSLAAEATQSILSKPSTDKLPEQAFIEQSVIEQSVIDEKKNTGGKKQICTPKENGSKSKTRDTIFDKDPLVYPPQSFTRAVINNSAREKCNPENGNASYPCSRAILIQPPCNASEYMAGNNICIPYAYPICYKDGIPYVPSNNMQVSSFEQTQQTQQTNRYSCQCYNDMKMFVQSTTANGTNCSPEQLRNRHQKLISSGEERTNEVSTPEKDLRKLLFSLAHSGSYCELGASGSPNIDCECYESVFQSRPKLSRTP